MMSATWACRCSIFDTSRPAVVSAEMNGGASRANVVGSLTCDHEKFREPESLLIEVVPIDNETPMRPFKLSVNEPSSTDLDDASHSAWINARVLESDTHRNLGAKVQLQDDYSLFTLTAALCFGRQLIPAHAHGQANQHSELEDRANQRSDDCADINVDPQYDMFASTSKSKK